MKPKMKILFVCTHNSCRSQMAEGWTRHLRGDLIEPYSAGVEPGALDARAVRVMREAGVDISGQKSKDVGTLAGVEFDYVVTVCARALEACPVIPAAARMAHAGFEDPPRLAAGSRTEEEALGHYRRVRDEIRAFVETLPRVLTGEGIEDVRGVVRASYGRIARESSSCCGSSGCCGGSPGGFQPADYAAEDLAGLPQQGAHMGLSCGNPLALASLRPGETVLDLGSGGGMDVLLAARRVGPAGRVIGVDMTPEMLGRARRNAREVHSRGGPDNVEFRLGEIEHLPVADASVDVVISNCVINLSPEKAQVWREIARVLKPGGRVAVSDLALRGPLPDPVKASVEALVGCIGGAVAVEETREMVRSAGLVETGLTLRSDYIDGMVSREDPLHRSLGRFLAPGKGLGDYVTSMDITASKPPGGGEPS
ncbi:MAG: arsenite methyltransferase [Bacteroidota bacterium]